MAEAHPASSSATRGPTTLLARTNVILGVGALLIAAIATLALYVFVINPITEQSAEDEAALLVLSAQTWVELPPDARPYYELEMAENHDLIISQVQQTLPTLEDYPTYFSQLKEQLAQRLEIPVELLVGDDLYWVDVPMGGYDLQIGFSPERRDIQPLYGAIVIVGLGAAIVFFSSLLIVRRIARPLVRVAEQAEHFRGTKQIEPLPETGPRELASLARNFNTMAQEISVLLDNRTTLLAGISHDLRTPLARMQLALALLPDTVDPSLIERFERNLESMDELIGDTLRFARGTSEAAATVAVEPFVKEIVESFDQPVHYRCESRASGADDVVHEASIAPSAFRRVLTNMIENALQHAGRVEVVVKHKQVRVEDDGPGIPEAHREQVFQPFYRMEGSRSRATGGSGLGLAIVAQLCQVHGWQVSIETSRLGGAAMVLDF